MAKYDPLGDYLAEQRGCACALKHVNIEEILGARLPPSARGHCAWWDNEADGAYGSAAVGSVRGGWWTTAARRTRASCDSSAGSEYRKRPRQRAGCGLATNPAMPRRGRRPLPAGSVR